MEGLPKIPDKKEENKDIPKDSIASKLKRWAKIGAIASVGLVGSPKESGVKSDASIKGNIKEYPYERYQEGVHSTLSFEDLVKTGKLEEIIGYQNELLELIPRLVQEGVEKIQDATLKKGYFKDFSDKELKAFIEKQKEDLDYRKELEKKAFEFLKDPEKNAYNEYLESLKETHKFYDTELLWLRQNVSSPEYKKKLEGELGEMTESVLNKRKERLNDKDYEIVEGFQVDPENNVTAAFDKGKDKVFLPETRWEGTGVHEFTHDMTNGNDLISEKAKKLYRESFDTSNLTSDELKQEIKYLINYNESYFNDPSERDVRKKALEYDMAKFGVKKYGEEFTGEHYKKLLELQKAGLLNEHSSDFLRMTKPEYFLQIMNEIAENKITKEDNQNLA